jgi:sensor histidine kinase YesM
MKKRYVVLMVIVFFLIYYGTNIFVTYRTNQRFDREIKAAKQIPEDLRARAQQCEEQLKYMQTTLDECNGIVRQQLYEKVEEVLKVHRN